MAKLKKNIILSSTVATAFEWYDYALFSHMAVLIGEKFFPSNDPGASLLNAFLLFAVGYLMRPVGGILFGMLGDKYGRRTSLSTAVFCMAIPTGIIGILPTYSDIGIAAPIMMTITRIMQGLSMGGALTGSASFLIEHSPPNKKGIYGSFPMASLCAGILMASLILSLLKYIMGTDNFNDYGWRIPFLLGFFIIYVSNYIKTKTEETPLFLEEKENGNLSKNPLAETLGNQKITMLMGIFINSTGSVIFYLQATYLVNYLKLFRNFSDDKIRWMLNAIFFMMIFVTLLSGWISDKIGRKKIYLFNIISIILFIPYALNSYESGSYISIVLCSSILAIQAAAYIGAEPALQSDLYDTKIRNTALSLSYNLATTIFGGTAPYILGVIVSKSGSIKFVSYYIIVCSILSLIGLCYTSGNKNQ